MRLDIVPLMYLLAPVLVLYSYFFPTRFDINQLYLLRTILCQLSHHQDVSMCPCKWEQRIGANCVWIHSQILSSFIFNVEDVSFLHVYFYCCNCLASKMYLIVATWQFHCSTFDWQAIKVIFAPPRVLQIFASIHNHHCQSSIPNHRRHC